MPYSRQRLHFRAVFALVAMAVGAYQGAIEAADRFDWLPLESQAAGLSADNPGGTQIIPSVMLTDTPKMTADLTKFTKRYTIDLAKFGIHNDGTHAAATSRGLNRALQDAKAAGANQIVFPPGTYLIHETMPLVFDHEHTVVDLNGATLQINSNGLPRYAIMEVVHGAKHLRITHGTLRGDKATHDFKTSPGTHEWGTGIRLVSGEQLEIDHLTAVDMTGDGVTSDAKGTRSREELLARILHSIYRKDLESGAFAADGTKLADTARTRTIKPFKIPSSEREFELGYIAGYMGYPFLKGRVFQAYFYDRDMRWLECKPCLQYRKVAVPSNAAWLHLEFNQPEVSDEPAHAGAVKGDWIARITNLRPSTHVHFHHNVLAHNRRLGMAFCGGQKWLIEQNRFEENGGTAPAYGVDFEDGSELMQDVVFRRNTFRGNHAGDLVVCAGSELVFEHNEFEKSVVTWGRLHNYVFRNNQYRGGSVIYTTRTGIASIHDNRYENCKLEIVFDTKAVADGLVRKSGQNVATPPLRLKRETLVNVANVSGTYFDLQHCHIRDSAFVAGPETRLIRLLDCQVNGSSLRYEAAGPPVAVRIERTQGAFAESGPGLARKQKSP